MTYINKKITLSSHIISALTRANINSLEDLDGYPRKKVLAFDGIGETSVKEIEVKMKEFGFTLTNEDRKNVFNVYRKIEDNCD